MTNPDKPQKPIVSAAAAGAPCSSSTLHQQRLAQLEAFLGEEGPLVTGTRLWKALGYRSAEAFRQARRRGTVQVALVEMPGRRGVFAFKQELLAYLARLGVAAPDQGSPGGER